MADTTKIAGVSTLGVEMFYAEFGGGTLPVSGYTKLNRINAIGEISLETEQIDASALEDLVSRYVAGRQDSGGTWEVTVNLTDETRDEWETLITTYNSDDNKGKGLWFQVASPYLEDAFYVLAQPPQAIPLPSMDQNGLMTVSMTLTISEYKGMNTKHVPA